MTAMDLDMTLMDGKAVVSLSGDVDLQVSPTVRKNLLGALADRRGLLIDLAQVTYMDSSGVASLVEAYQSARKGNLPFALVAVSPAVLRVLQLARLDQVFPIHASLDDAAKAGL